MRAVDLLINSILPEDIRSDDHSYDKKGIARLFKLIADKHPDKFTELSKKISDIGRDASYYQGETLTLNDFFVDTKKEEVFADLKEKLKQADLIKNKEKRDKLKADLYLATATELQKRTIDAIKNTDNNLGLSVISGARGNPAQLRGMVTAPAVYMDYKDNVIPFLIENSFAEGLRPYEYAASTFGARKGVISTKACLMEGTLVRMSDGTDKEIEKIKVGDEVIGCTIDGKLKPTKVSKVFYQGKQSVYKVQFKDTVTYKNIKTVYCTVDHKFLIRHKNSNSDNIHNDIDRLANNVFNYGASRFISIGNSNEVADRENIVTMYKFYGTHFCYDIEVDIDSHLFVLTNGMVVSNSTREAGDMLKQLTQVGAYQTVTENDCGTHNGVSIGVDDNSIKGRVMLSEVGGVPAGTIIDSHAIKILKENGVSTIQVRSPMTCQAKHGVCAKCLGTLPGNKKLAPIGYSAGITAATTIGEPMAQASLNTKHGGGAASGAKKTFSGLPVLKQFLQSPEGYANKATVSSTDGRVEIIEDAPQGGKFITINGERHYVLPDFGLNIQVGDIVEAGDVLSEGLADVEEIVRYRGIGEGRKYFAERFSELLKDSGINVNKRNIETMARSVVNHIRIKNFDESSSYLPEDVIYYSEFESKYTPPASAKQYELNDDILNKYLEEPVLHYTIGTRITPRIKQNLKDSGYTRVTASDLEPTFEPEFVRLRTGSHAGKDWMTKLHSSLLTKNIKEDAIMGHETNYKENYHFAPRLAFGEDFGKKIETTGKF